MQILFRVILFIFCSLPFLSNGQSNSGPQFKFDQKEDTYNFGTVIDGEVVTYDYKFTNVGNQPLIIYKAEVACNCTSAEWPKTPILPGKSGVIKVTYKSEGNVGNVHKEIFIKSNAILPPHYKKTYDLKLTGTVKAKK